MVKEVQKHPVGLYSSLTLDVMSICNFTTHVHSFQNMILHHPDCTSSLNEAPAPTVPPMLIKGLWELRPAPSMLPSFYLPPLRSGCRFVSPNRDSSFFLAFLRLPEVLLTEPNFILRGSFSSYILDSSIHTPKEQNGSTGSTLSRVCRCQTQII